ncbi:hypothetical protein QYE76_067995 [Lolium multiflorum]|uniref:Reverse transcriptase domain-containing protein n=1 Tax=Lolium multiflorum TaxID=4521 RepID=A0AAD8SFX1_LOLMU|nr:hypothetical protein QYE76_067995 [Lolium multiflorum]
MDRSKQIKTGLVNFVPHPPSRLDAYAHLEEPMEMAFGKFYFRVGKEGSHRLEVPVSSRTPVVDSDLSDSSSSFESGAEEISPPRFVKTATSEQLVKLFGNISFESSADSSISSDLENIDSFDFIDKSTYVWEIRLKEEDEIKTAFITPYGVFCYRTMPFGLKNVGATYQRMMQKCLATQIGRNVQVYIDDIVITTKQGSTLIKDLKETFDNLDKFCLKLNPTNCSFGVPARELLGFLVSARGIEANPEKIQAIVTIRKPTKLKEIQQLTGRVAALSRFVARLGEKALPFYALIKQGEKIEWNDGADRAFEDLKRTISTPPILVAPKEKEPLLLYIAATPQVCDAVNDSMMAYKEVYNELEKLFDGCEVNHISRLSNDEADVLANIGSQCLAIPPGVFWEEISERSTKAKKQQKKKKEKVEKSLGAPAASEANTTGDEEESHEVMMVAQIPWMQV